MLVPLILLAGGAAAAVILVTGSSDSSKHAADSTVDTSAAQRREAQAKFDRCEQTTKPLLDKLHDLDSRLDVGLNYNEYTNKVGDVRVAYDQVTPTIGDQPECLSGVGVPAEAAFNQYVKASNKWGNCFDDVNCSTDAIQPTLRKYWAKASTEIDSADSGLQEIKQPEG